MKQVKLHLPKELENMFDESRPELIEDDSRSTTACSGERGQNRNCPPNNKCPHIEYCHVRKFGRINCMNERTIRSCQTYKFYNRYGADYNMLGI